jgi:hypothetical protein
MSGSLLPVKTTLDNGIPVFQSRIESAQGGFVLDHATLTVGDTVKAGQPLGYDESTRVAKVVKLAKVYENATNSATDIKVYKGHHFKVGDYIAFIVGDAAYAITVIDTSNAAYDLITVGTTLGDALTADTSVLFQSSATGAAAAAYSVTAKGLLYQDTVVASGASVSVVIRGTVYERRVTLASAAVKTALPHIIYSTSK